MDERNYRLVAPEHPDKWTTSCKCVLIKKRFLLENFFSHEALQFPRRIVIPIKIWMFIKKNESTLHLPLKGNNRKMSTLPLNVTPHMKEVFFLLVSDLFGSVRINAPPFNCCKYVVFVHFKRILYLRITEGGLSSLAVVLDGPKPG